MPDKRGLYVHPPEVEPATYPPEVVRIARERTQILLRGWSWNTAHSDGPPDLMSLLVSCYLQGVHDTAAAAALRSAAAAAPEEKHDGTKEEGPIPAQ